jgi:hypothetical protein
MIRALIALTLSLAATAAPACPLCKDSVPNDQAAGTADLKNNVTARGENISGGINSSILFMFGGLFFALGMVTVAMIKGARGTRVGHASACGTSAGERSSDESRPPRVG